MHLVVEQDPRQEQTYPRVGEGQVQACYQTALLFGRHWGCFSHLEVACCTPLVEDLHGALIQGPLRDCWAAHWEIACHPEEAHGCASGQDCAGLGY